MPNSIGIITWERLCLIYYHRLISFPSKKAGTFPKIAETFYKIEQPLHPLPGDPICTTRLPQCLAC